MKAEAVEPTPASGDAALAGEEAHARACELEPGPERSRLIGLSEGLAGEPPAVITELIAEEADPKCREALLRGYTEGRMRPILTSPPRE
jgi:hypothetical protein